MLLRNSTKKLKQEAFSLGSCFLDEYTKTNLGEEKEE